MRLSGLFFVWEDQKMENGKENDRREQSTAISCKIRENLNG